MEERLVLHELVGRYGILADTADLDHLAALWEEDGILSGMTHDPIVGRMAVRNMMAANREYYESRLRHQFTNIACELDASGSQARVHCYAVITDWTAKGQGRPICCNLCTFELVRHASDWLIRRLNVEVLMPPGAFQS